MIFSTAIVLVAEHKYQHHKSCFSKGICCRYFIPHQPCNCTSIGGVDTADEYIDDKIYFQRSVGCEYINAYNIVMFLLTKSNCDFSLLRTHNGDYSIKYVAKCQDAIDSEAVITRFHAGLVRSFEKRAAIESGSDNIDLQKRGISKLFSILYHYMNMID